MGFAADDNKAPCCRLGGTPLPTPNFGHTYADGAERFPGNGWHHTSRRAYPTCVTRQRVRRAGDRGFYCDVAG